MADVFILGAGFSKALSAEMPLTSDLRDDIFSDPTYADSLEADLWENNFEMLLTYLSQPHPWLPEKESLRNRAAFLDLSSAIQTHLLRRIGKATQDIANQDTAWMQHLFSCWKASRARVITLNYDTLIEILCGDDKTNTCDFYPVDMKTLVMNGGSFTRSSTFSLFKLHGSINWFYSGHDSASGEDIYATVYKGGLDGFFKTDLRWQYSQLKHKVPLIIPPVLDKGLYFKNVSLRSTWEQALLALREADRIFCLGYSLPESDVTMRFFLQGELKRNTPFYVVNRDANALAHFQKLLPKYNFKESFFGEASVRNFVEAYRNGRLS
jgi:hypothetical protein